MGFGKAHARNGEERVERSLISLECRRTQPMENDSSRIHAPMLTPRREERPTLGRTDDNGIASSDQMAWNRQVYSPNLFDTTYDGPADSTVSTTMKSIPSTENRLIWVDAVRSEDTDAPLVQAAKLGDHAAFSELSARYAAAKNDGYICESSILLSIDGELLHAPEQRRAADAHAGSGPICSADTSPALRERADDLLALGSGVLIHQNFVVIKGVNGLFDDPSYIFLNKMR